MLFRQKTKSLKNIINKCIAGKPRNVTVESTRIKTEVNTSEIIIMQVVSFPAPTVEWRRENGFQWTVTKDKYDYRYRIQSNVHMKSRDDFGEYGINICNILGCYVQNVILTPKGNIIVSRQLTNHANCLFDIQTACEFFSFVCCYSSRFL